MGHGYPGSSHRNMFIFVYIHSMISKMIIRLIGIQVAPSTKGSLWEAAMNILYPRKKSYIEVIQIISGAELYWIRQNPYI